MWSERTHETQTAEAHVEQSYSSPNASQPKTLNLLQDRVKVYLKLFLDTSSIHGFNHLVASRRQYFEIFLWLTILVLSTYGSVCLSLITWRRYQSSPTVVSMDRDMFAWNTTFPGVTICPNSILNIDKRKLEVYLNESSVENKTELENFIIGLANASLKSFEYVPKYSEIPPSHYVDLLYKLSVDFKPSLTIGIGNVALTAIPTVTEMGICYAVNSGIAVYNSPEYRAANRWDILKDNTKTSFIHPLDGEVFAQVINLSVAYNVYIHGPHEIPDLTSKFQHSDEYFYTKIYVTAVTVYTSPAAAKLSIQQRRCRFSHENNLKHNSIYTYTMCRIECRIKLCLKYCKCVPHFYRTIGDEKICDPVGLNCLANYTDELYTLRAKDGKRINCDCYPACDDINYVIQQSKVQEWFMSTNLQWGMVSYPRMRYRRDIIFGFTDLLVSVGGMAGLFLGCSVLSFVEIMYFITLRLWCRKYGR